MGRVGGSVSLVGNSVDYTALLNSILGESQDIQADTTQLVTLHGVTNTTLSTIDGKFTSLLTKLNETCAGAPINVSVCNPTDVSGLLTELQAIEANTDTLEQGLLTIDGTLQSINVVSGVTNVKLDTVNANLSTINTNITTEGDQTQALITTTNTNLTNILAKLNTACGASPINVNVCPVALVPATITSGTTSPIPAGAVSVLIRKNIATGTVSVAGQTLNTLKEGISLDAPSGKTLPAIVVATTGAATYTWTAVS
jgi:hypothetical protein